MGLCGEQSGGADGSLCVCRVEWDEPGNPEGFTWYYNEACPVAVESHRVWRPFFAAVAYLGHGYAMSPEGSIIIKGDGRTG